MNTPSWQLLAWATVIRNVNDFEPLLRDLEYLGSTVQTSDDGSGLASGHTVWATRPGKDRVGLAWEWAEVRPGVPTICDSMNVLSNLVVLGADGAALTGSKRMLYLNNVLHELDWQRTIRRPVQRRQDLLAA